MTQTMKLSRMVLSGALALCLGLPAQAALFTFAADLSGAAEFPANASPATGTAVVVYDSVLHTLTIDIDFSDLLGTTTASHIHAPADPGVNAGVAVTPVTLPGFPFGVTSGSYNAVVDLALATSYTGAFFNNFGGGTEAGSEAALFTFMREGRSYVNVHTTSYPGGEIRGQLAPVPDAAATVCLFSLAMGIVGLAARRSRLAA